VDARDGESKILETESFPKEREPADFSGVAGYFEIKAIVDKKDAGINEPLTLALIVSGINFGV
jgi:hypothetical protein